MADKERIQDIKVLNKVRVYLIQGGVVKTAWGVFDTAGKLYIIKKKGFRSAIDRNKYYIVKQEHLFLESDKKRKYMVMSVFIDTAQGVSVPPPRSQAPPWRPDELELAQKVVSNVLIMRQFEEERRRLMQLMGRLQLVMGVMFIAALVFAAVLYYINSQQLINQLNDVIQKVFPAPVTPAP